MEINFLDLIQNIRTPVGDTIMSAVTKLGNGGIIWIILTIILLLNQKTRKAGLILAAALCVDVVLCNMILKNLVARMRPYDFNNSITLIISKPKDFSFPSGHTAASFTAVTGLFLSGKKRLWKASLILATLIAFSRMYLYVHYPTDIIGGILVGIFSGYIGYFIVDYLSEKKRLH